MPKHNPSNERIKHVYLGYLKEAMGQSEDSVDAVAMALSRFEEYTKHRDFKQFHPEQARAFKRNLAEQTGRRSGEKLSKATLHATLAFLKKFFQWLSREQGYKSRVKYSDADYFNLSEKEVRVATARREQQSPTLEQVKHVLRNMPERTEIERRNRALIAFTLLTGARDRATASTKLKHVEISLRYFEQDAREVNTKASKSFRTYFFPIGDEVHQILADWVRYLREEKLWGSGDPLFPATRISLGVSRQFEVAGLDRKCWGDASPIRKIFRDAFVAAGLPYFNPHSFRKTLTRLGEQLCRTPEQFKVWSQNLGHEQVLTTFLSYGEVSRERQGELIQALAQQTQSEMQSNAELIADALYRKLCAPGVKLQRPANRESQMRE